MQIFAGLFLGLVCLWLGLEIFGFVWRELRKLGGGNV
jgi:hypothetical protein